MHVFSRHLPEKECGLQLSKVSNHPKKVKHRRTEDARTPLWSYDSGHMKRVQPWRLLCWLWFIVAGFPAIDFLTIALFGHNPASLFVMLVFSPPFGTAIYLAWADLRGKMEEIDGVWIFSAFLYSLATLTWWPVSIAGWQKESLPAGAILVALSLFLSLPFFALATIISLFAIGEILHRAWRRNKNRRALGDAL